MSRARISLGSQDLAIFYSGNFLIQLNGVLRNVASTNLNDIGATDSSAFRRTIMKSIVRISAVVIGVAIGSTIAGPAGAAQGPSNRCYGEIVSGIASTWPWAHNDEVDVPPPPGALALWIQEFGPFVGISSVRDLQVAFCDEQ